MIIYGVIAINNREQHLRHIIEKYNITNKYVNMLCLVQW